MWISSCMAPVGACSRPTKLLDSSSPRSRRPSVLRLSPLALAPRLPSTTCRSTCDACKKSETGSSACSSPISTSTRKERHGQLSLLLVYRSADDAHQRHHVVWYHDDRSGDHRFSGVAALYSGC